MDELVKLVSQKTGLSEEKSRQAVEIVLAYLKEKLPEPIGGQLESILEGHLGQALVPNGLFENPLRNRLLHLQAIRAWSEPVPAHPVLE